MHRFVIPNVFFKDFLTKGTVLDLQGFHPTAAVWKVKANTTMEKWPQNAKANVKGKCVLCIFFGGLNIQYTYFIETQTFL